MMICFHSDSETTGIIQKKALRPLEWQRGQQAWVQAIQLSILFIIYGINAA